MRNARRDMAGLAAVVLLIAGCGAGGIRGPHEEASFAPFVVTPGEVVDEMLRLAGVGKDDIVYDLGSGDGRIVITAARIYGARGVGFELDGDLVRRSNEDARRAGVGHLVQFRQQDVMTVDLSPATVVTIYLSREANLRLRPALQRQLRPGARVVTHDFDMGDWRPDVYRLVQDESLRLRQIYLWTIKPRPSEP